MSKNPDGNDKVRVLPSFSSATSSVVGAEAGGDGAGLAGFGGGRGGGGSAKVGFCGFGGAGGFDAGDGVYHNSNPPPALLVTDSQNLHGTDFWGEVNGDTSRAGRPGLEWRVEVLEGFVGSGVMVEEDQEYDIRVRMLSTGWRDEILG